MKNQTQQHRIPFTGAMKTIELSNLPSMAAIFPKAFWLGLTRSSKSLPEEISKRLTLRFSGLIPTAEKIENYCQTCGFSPGREKALPVSFFQSLFVPLFGRFITSDAFPINPLGLIHISQRLTGFVPVPPGIPLDLSCTLSNMTRVEKGIESEFTLDVMAENENVWQGKSVFLTRLPSGKTAEKKTKQIPTPLPRVEKIIVPAGTGRAYASVSGDYNPHHLFDLTAKLFGFKKAIAHGMWTLGRSVAELEKISPFPAGNLDIQARFKRPVLIPARLALGAETATDPDTDSKIIHFDLTDDITGMPHIIGTACQTTGSQT